MSETRRGQRVVIALSGGVDSAVAAALLQRAGYDVVGMMLRLWNEPGAASANRCCTPDAQVLAKRVADRLSIPFYAVDAQAPFYEAVVAPFVHAYAAGQTPNPCVACNRQVRWGFLLREARLLGADYLATGHYVRRIVRADGRIELHRARDLSKDQSYVLHVLGQAELAHALFPLGELTKVEVRALAAELRLPVAHRPDSQDLCFLGASDLPAFLQRQDPSLAQPGPIRDVHGRSLGTHPGLAFFTIGQRKGIGIAAPRPLYVLAKDAAANALIVGEAEALGRIEFTAGPIHWVAGAPPPDLTDLAVKVRATAALVPCALALADGGVTVTTVAPLRDVTPGQLAVFYRGDEVLGGGPIR